MTLISEGDILESNFPPEMIWISSVIINIFANAMKSLFITTPHPEMLCHIYTEEASPSVCSLLKKKFGITSDPRIGGCCDAVTMLTSQCLQRAQKIPLFVHCQTRILDFFFSLHFQDRDKEEKHRDCFKRSIVLSRDMSVLNKQVD